jgi:hypothetical protein
LEEEIEGLQEREGETSHDAMKIALLGTISVKENRLTELLKAQAAASGNYTDRDFFHFMCLNE